MLAEELSVINAESPLWHSMRPLLNAALQLEQDESFCWHGWSKAQIEGFLRTLPPHCTLVVAVWANASGAAADEQEMLQVGWVAEVRAGAVCAVRTLDAFVEAGLPPIQQLEAGIEHALEIMRVVRMQLAPVAVALFTDMETWREWVYTDDGRGGCVDKGAILQSLAHEGRCVLMGSQISHHHS